MAFVTAQILIDAPASALNNLGAITGKNVDNATGVKAIRVGREVYPYVSAQAFRYWLRGTLEAGTWGWKAAPMYREEKIAYTDANPMKWWDDDLFGYMRAHSKKSSAQAARQADASRAGETSTTETVTRVSPFRVSTLVSLTSVTVTTDFGVMARHEGDPVPFEHEFYRTTFQGTISLDLHAAGTFTYVDRTGYLNLDAPRTEEAKKIGLEEVPSEKAYRLPFKERVERVQALFQGLSHLDGGAKQTLHYTDVSPDVLLLAVTRGGNNVFGHVFGADDRKQPVVRIDALKEILTVHRDEFMSPIYVGWVKGYVDSARTQLESALDDENGLKPWKDQFIIEHPRTAAERFISDLEQHPEWLA